MADDFTSMTGIEAVLADTADYAVERDVDKAKRRATAYERKLDFASFSARDTEQLRFDMAVIQSQLAKIYSWIESNESTTDAQRLANPDVTHADFSTFGQYRDA